MRHSARRTGAMGLLLLVTATQPGTPRAIAAAPPTLDAAPQNCSGSTHFVSLLNLSDNGVAYSNYIGGDPFWVGGFWGPRATLHLTGVRTYYEPGYGWAAFVMFVLKRSFTHTMTLRGGTVDGRTPLLFDAAEKDAPNGETRTLTLEGKRQTTFPGGSGPQQWPTFPGDIVAPRAGCYYLKATWPGGTWRITFAAGR
jgi:hypothetical protein